MGAAWNFVKAYGPRGRSVTGYGLGGRTVRFPQEARSNWFCELSAQQRALRANWILRERPGSKVRVALSAPLERLLEPAPGELRLREKDHRGPHECDSYEHVPPLMKGLMMSTAGGRATVK